MAVINSDRGTHYQAFLNALDKGWKVSPVAGADNHGLSGIKSRKARTFVLAANLTKVAILDAVKHRRTYASLDGNLQCEYTVNGQVMGSTLAGPTEFRFDVTISDPDTDKPGDRITKIDIVKDGGAVARVYDGAPGYTVRWTTSISDSANKYFFVRVWNAAGATRCQPILQSRLHGLPPFGRAGKTPQCFSRRIDDPREPVHHSYLLASRLPSNYPSRASFTMRKLNGIVAALIAAMFAPAILAAAAPVGIFQDNNSFTLSNGIVSARISKTSGDLLSLKFKNMEMLDANSGHPPGYWSHDVSRGKREHRVTIDPASNGGARAEISIKGISDGRALGSGPGGSAIADIEIRYALGRGDSAIYTYCAFTHPTNYPATSLGEARFCAKLNDDLFDWMTVDARRNMEMITAYDWNHATQMNMKEARRMNTGLYRGEVEHKYDYSANQFDVRAWGWSSTTNHVGLWFINPSVEYLSGGPTKFELSAHRDATFDTENLTAPAPPTLLNYWRSSHYGGAVCAIGTNEAWTKVIGPFLIYCNSAHDHDAMWKDALARSSKESASWPCDWVDGVDYPHKKQRATVSGRIRLHDNEFPKTKLTNLLVGLSAPDYSPPPSRGRFAAFGPRVVDWQNDARNYEFWVRGEPNGKFSIPNVRPGHYTLHAIADGALGEFVLTNIAIPPGENLRLPGLNWQPIRYGKQLWDIGIPNRSASEFFKGNDHFHWGWYLQYPKLFPDDVHYVIGNSDFRKDWFFEQVPHNENPSNTTGLGRGRATTWSVTFNLPQAPHGKATLRLAICGVGTRTLNVDMNGQSIGAVTGLFYNATINRDGVCGSWMEHDLPFDASMMNAGENVLKLTVPAGGLTSGIEYDYLRLELDESALPPPRPSAAE